MTIAERTLADVLASDPSGSSSGVEDANNSSASSLRARFSTPEVSQYLSRLTSLSLPEIFHEPATLASEASQLTNSLTSLCYTEYPTFLALHRTSSVLSSTLSSFSASLSALTTALPQLDAQARRFQSETAAVQDVRTKAQRVLAAHDTLADILDIPPLIDACVRGAHYQEALDLATYASRLSAALPDIPVVQDVAAEASHAAALMRAQLLARLREPAKLPALFKAIAFLRKMDLDSAALEERELALAFLVSRQVYFEGTLGAVKHNETDDTARFLKKYIDVWREGVSDLITQYTTIFLDRCASRELEIELRFLLSTLTHRALDTLLDVLRARLQHVSDITSLSALLTQLTHCASALSRFGLDFSAFLPPLFEHAAEHRFALALKSATDTFLTVLSDAQKYRRQPSMVLCTPASAAAPPEDTTPPKLLHVPPPVLASYPPLAIYTNAILTALNSLRLLAPASLLKSLLSALDSALTRASVDFLLYVQNAFAASATAKTRMYSTDDEEPPDQNRILLCAGKVYTKLLVPYVRRALVEGVYGEMKVKTIQMSGDLKDCLEQWDAWLDELPKSA